jgi:hypothetical protein
MKETNERKEYDTIKQILHNNKYDVKILNEITRTTDIQTQNEIKGGGFTYFGRRTKFITKLFTLILKFLSRLTSPQENY